MALERMAVVTTPASDKLLLRKMSGREEMGRPFAYELDLLSLDPALALDSVLGQTMAVELELQDEAKVRYFHGVVTRFARTGSEGRYETYRATLRPWVWLLSRTTSCRIFQDLTVPEVIKQVFRDLGFSDFDDELNGTYRKWDYLVQYRETALNFVTRLMEREGIYYFFKHTKDRHHLVLADSYAAHETTAGYQQVPYYPPGEERESDHLSGWSASQAIQPGAYMVNDFDFKRPKAGLKSKSMAQRSHPHSELEYYDYPGEYVETADGEQYARRRLEAWQAQYEQFAGHGDVRGLGPGVLFSLTECPLADQNREYLVTEAVYLIENDEYESGKGTKTRVHCSLGCVQSQVAFRLSRRAEEPLISGPQTAIVVGKAGEEIWTDQYGRVKVQFHWDREGKRNESSSCWVRVAQFWAGPRWGSIHVPRIGQEVIVEFLEGDPDRPIITGRVYNADNMPPYELPGAATQSGWKSRSTKQGNPDNFNELRFEDLKGEEQLYMQAERNMDTLVKVDQTLTVGGNRTKDIAQNETTSIGENRTESVTGNESIDIAGTRRESVVKTETIAIGETRDTTVTLSDTLNIGQAYTLTVGAGATVGISGPHKLSVGKGQNARITGNDELHISKDQSLIVQGSRNQKVDTNDTLHVGKKLVIQVADEIVIKTGDASITMKKNGDIVISGKNVAVKGSAKIDIKASSDVVIKGSKVSQN